MAWTVPWTNCRIIWICMEFYFANIVVGSRSLQNVSNSYNTFSDRSRFLMPNTNNISPHLLPYSNTESVASFWLRYFKLLVSILEMYVITIPTSHVKLYLGRADLMLKIPFINLVMIGYWPTDTPSILINVNNKDCAVFIKLYPTPLWNKSYKNNKIWFVVVSYGLKFLSLQNCTHLDI